MNLKLIGGPKDGEVIDIPEDSKIKFINHADRITDDGVVYYDIHRIDGEYVGIFKEPEDAV
jgi:hypothetical protein